MIVSISFRSVASTKDDQRKRKSSARQKSASNRVGLSNEFLFVFNNFFLEKISEQDMCIVKINYVGRDWKESDFSYEFQPVADEIIVVQNHIPGGSMIVFKGFVRPGGKNLTMK